MGKKGGRGSRESEGACFLNAALVQVHVAQDERVERSLPGEELSRVAWPHSGKVGAC